MSNLFQRRRNSGSGEQNCTTRPCSVHISELETFECGDFHNSFHTEVVDLPINWPGPACICTNVAFADENPAISRFIISTSFWLYNRCSRRGRLVLFYNDALATHLRVDCQNCPSCIM